MLAHTLIFLPAVGFAIAAASGILLRTRREREEKRTHEDFKITK
jgi:hypothetical protein